MVKILRVLSRHVFAADEERQKVLSKRVFISYFHGFIKKFLFLIMYHISLMLYYGKKVAKKAKT